MDDGIIALAALAQFFNPDQKMKELDDALAKKPSGICRACWRSYRQNLCLRQHHPANFRGKRLCSASFMSAELTPIVVLGSLSSLCNASRPSMAMACSDGSDVPANDWMGSLE